MATSGTTVFKTDGAGDISILTHYDMYPEGMAGKLHEAGKYQRIMKRKHNRNISFINSFIGCPKNIDDTRFVGYQSGEKFLYVIDLNNNISCTEKIYINDTEFKYVSVFSGTIREFILKYM